MSGPGISSALKESVMLVALTCGAWLMNAISSRVVIRYIGLISIHMYGENMDNGCYYHHEKKREMQYVP